MDNKVPEPPTAAQLRMISALAEELELDIPTPANRAHASMAIDTLKSKIRKLPPRRQMEIKLRRPHSAPHKVSKRRWECRQMIHILGNPSELWESYNAAESGGKALTELHTELWAKAQAALHRKDDTVREDR